MKYLFLLLILTSCELLDDYINENNLYIIYPSKDKSTLNEINNAISNASYGDSVYLKAGEYIIDGSIIMKNGIKLFGAGITTHIRTTDSTHAIIMYDLQNDTSEDIIYEIENMYLEGTGGYNPDYYNSNPQENAIYLGSVYNGQLMKVSVTNVLIENVRGGGIFTKRAKDVIFESCQVNNSNFVAFTPVGENITVKNCHADYIRMLIESVNAIYFEGAQQTSILVDNVSGYNLLNYGIRWCGATSGIFKNIILNGNESINFEEMASEAYGFYFSSDSSDNKTPIGECEIDNFQVYHMREVLRLQNIEDAPIGNIKILNGNAEDIYLCGIRIGVNSQDNIDSIRIQGNEITNFNHFGAYADGAGIRLQNVKNVIINNNIIQSSQISKWKATPIFIINIDNILIEDNNFYNPNCIPYIWATESENIQNINNTDIGGIYYY